MLIAGIIYDFFDNPLNWPCLAGFAGLILAIASGRFWPVDTSYKWVMIYMFSAVILGTSSIIALYIWLGKILGESEITMLLSGFCSILAFGSLFIFTFYLIISIRDL